VFPVRRGTFSMGTSHTLDQLDICFDDTHAIASAGLLLPATLAQRLGIAQAADQLIDLGERPGAAHPGAKLLALVHVMVAGGDYIDDVDVLRSPDSLAADGSNERHKEAGKPGEECRD